MRLFDRIANAVAKATGHPLAWLVALAIVFGGWAADRWAEVDAICTAATFVMVFFLQRGANCHAEAMQRKLDEVVRGEPGAVR